MDTQSTSHTADYIFLDSALKSRWSPLLKLENEINEFVPKPLSEYSEYRESEMTRYRELNLNLTEGAVAKFVDRQLSLKSSPKFQFIERFHDLFMNEYVIVVMLSHSLSEAFINAILAIGLTRAGSEDLFPLLERTNFKQKWISAPKSIDSSYSFPVGSALHETLNYLTQQRNALIHYKIELIVNGQKKLDGSNFQQVNPKEEIRWIQRFFSLPYDLLEFADSELPNFFFHFIPDRKPIEIASVHKNA